MPISPKKHPSRASLGLLAMGCLLSATGPIASAAEPVFIDVQSKFVLHQMHAGIGCNLHAIETPLPYDEERSFAGSVWGANPPAGDDAAWARIHEHLDWLGFDWVRVGISLQMWEPEQGRFTPDGPEMKILYRYLDYCEKKRVDVYLQHFFHNTAWLTPPEYGDDPVKIVRAAPRDLEAMTDGLVALLRHLVRDKGYSCIKQFGLTNEPFETWSWWIKSFAPDVAEDPVPAFRMMADKLKRENLGLQFTGPDISLYENHSIHPDRSEFFKYFDALDFHQYVTRWDFSTQEFISFGETKGKLDRIVDASRLLGEWKDYGLRHGKPVFASEMGTFMNGFGRKDPGVTTYPSLLKDVESVLRFSAIGIDGFARWNFLNRGDLDGPWQMLRTWDIEKGRMLPHEDYVVEEIPYYMWGLLSRYTAKRSEIMDVRVQGGVVDKNNRVFATAYRSPGSRRISLFVVNDGAEPYAASIALGIPGGVVQEIRLDEGSFARGAGNPVRPQAVTLPADGVFHTVLPAMSLLLLSQHDLGDEGPGVVED